jgi:hypothetical protein
LCAAKGRPGCCAEAGGGIGRLVGGNPYGAVRIAAFHASRVLARRLLA